MFLHFFPFLNKRVSPQFLPRCPPRAWGGGSSKSTGLLNFFSSNPSPESKGFSDVQVFTKWLVFSYLLVTLGSRFPDLWFPMLMFSFFIHLILTAWRNSVLSHSQGPLGANGKRKEPREGLPLDKGHLYTLRHLASPSVISAGNNLEAGRLTELDSAVSVCAHQFSSERLIRT